VEFNLSRRGYRLPSPAHDAGSDASQDSHDSEDENGDIDIQLTKVWRQFLLDVTSKSPNKRHAYEGSYCILTKDQRLGVNEATYKNQRLSDYFVDCQWKVPEETEWDLVFNRLFPPKNGKPLAGKVQNYETTTYYPEWAKLKERADENTFNRMRRALRMKFDCLYWMPFAQTDRIWGTKPDIKFSKSSGIDRKAAAPQIFVRFAPATW
jgi:hypothetical protein